MEEHVRDDILFLQTHGTRYLILGADDNSISVWELKEYGAVVVDSNGCLKPS